MAKRRSSTAIPSTPSVNLNDPNQDPEYLTLIRQLALNEAQSGDQAGLTRGRVEKTLANTLSDLGTNRDRSMQGTINSYLARGLGGSSAQANDLEATNYDYGTQSGRVQQGATDQLSDLERALVEDKQRNELSRAGGLQSATTRLFQRRAQEGEQQRIYDQNAAFNRERQQMALMQPSVSLAPITDPDSLGRYSGAFGTTLPGGGTAIPSNGTPRPQSRYGGLSAIGSNPSGATGSLPGTPRTSKQSRLSRYATIAAGGIR